MNSEFKKSKKEGRRRIDLAELIVEQSTPRQLRLIKGLLLLCALVMAANVANLLSIAYTGQPLPLPGV